MVNFSSFFLRAEVGGKVKFFLPSSVSSSSGSSVLQVFGACCMLKVVSSAFNEEAGATFNQVSSTFALR